MRTHKKRSLHEHLLAIGLAVLLVAAISVGVNNSGLLRADILQGGDTSAADIADINYSVQSGALVLSSAKTFNDAESLTFMIVYNHESVRPQIEQNQTIYDYTSSSGKDGVIHMTVFFSGMLAGNHQIVSIPFTGNYEEINISDATMLFSGGTIDGLAIRKQ